MDTLDENLAKAGHDTTFLLDDLRTILHDSNGALTVVVLQLIEQAVKIEQTLKAIKI